MRQLSGGFQVGEQWLAYRLVGKVPLLAVLFSIAGCSFFNGSESEISAGTATIVGSKSYSDLTGIGDARAYVVAIDGNAVGDGPAGWDSPVTVIPGWHDFHYEISSDAPYAGSGETQAKLAAGKSYVLRFSEPKPVSENLFLASGWIEEDKGAAISNKAPVEIRPAGLELRGGQN